MLPNSHPFHLTYLLIDVWEREDVSSEMDRNLAIPASLFLSSILQLMKASVQAERSNFCIFQNTLYSLADCRHVSGGCCSFVSYLAFFFYWGKCVKF